MRYELTLHYRGELKSNGNRNHKHNLRRHFHKQLKTYMSHDSRKEQFGSIIDKLEIPIDTFRFVPIISDYIYMAAKIDIFMLKTGSRGSIVTHGGDIDNRLKTLLDSLKVPEINALPNNSIPDTDEDPFYCLLKDDCLITSLAVSTDQLLEPSINDSEVDIIIRVIGEETESFVITTKD